MSIEQALKELTEATLANTDALNKLLSTTTSVAASSTASNDGADAAEEAPKRERGKPSPGKARRTKEEVAEDEAADAADAAASGDDADGAVTFESVKGKLSAWLGEFAKEEDAKNPDGAHPEVLARKAALKSVLNKLTGTDDGKLGAIAKDAEKVGKLNTWFEDKALTVDKGYGVGRLAADPEPADDDDSGDDELDI